MKKVWIKTPWNKEIITYSLEKGIDAVLVPSGYSSKVKELGKIKTISEDGDLKLGQDVIEFTIKSKSDEEEALKLSKSKTLILKMEDWTIIPLENLIAQTKGLIVEVQNSQEAKTAIGILEKGVDGVLLASTDINEIKKTIDIVKSITQSINLVKAKITNIQRLNMGDRVCIDTCTNMKEGEGILVGNSSSAMFLVHSESIENPYVASRPFRVNAGAIHAYTLMPDNKTKYLSELKTGDEILIVNYKGETQIGVIGRIKIEKRPLLLIEGEIEQEKISLVLQNAETIRLTTPDGKAISVVNLQQEMEVLAYKEKIGRHFGIKIEETIIEK